MTRKRASGPPKETNIEPVNNERKREKTGTRKRKDDHERVGTGKMRGLGEAKRKEK
jgi:hypothetical protein